MLLDVKCFQYFFTFNGDAAKPEYEYSFKYFNLWGPLFNHKKQYHVGRPYTDLNYKPVCHVVLENKF